MNQPQPVARSRKIFSEPENLADIRSQSCYKTLRFVINICTILTLGIAIATTLVSIITAHSFFNFVKPGPNDQLYSALAILGTGIISSIIIIASRQMGLLFVDIADTLISEHNRNRNR